MSLDVLAIVEHVAVSVRYWSKTTCDNIHAECKHDIARAIGIDILEAPFYA